MYRIYDKQEKRWREDLVVLSDDEDPETEEKEDLETEEIFCISCAGRYSHEHNCPESANYDPFESQG